MVLPNVVRATVLERIRLLDRSQRSVVMCASVIGRRFEVTLLMAAVTCTQDQVRAALDRACALELVVPDGPGRQTYSFRHALTRDVIYAELITARTRPLHRRIARALERITTSSDAPIDDLAYHFWAAGDVRRGIRYNELAGDRAAGVHAEAEARTYYGRARGMSEIDSHAFARLTAKLSALGPAEIR